MKYNLSLSEGYSFSNNTKNLSQFEAGDADCFLPVVLIIDLLHQIQDGDTDSVGDGLLLLKNKHLVCLTVQQLS